VIVLPGVDAEGVHPALWLFLGAMADAHRVLTGDELVVTSLRRPQGARRSLHAPPAGELCRAADVRRWYLDRRRQSRTWCDDLRADWGRWLGVLLEPEELTSAQLAERGGLQAVQPHIHVQLKAPSWPRVL
jgi:hypothetical protein